MFLSSEENVKVEDLINALEEYDPNQNVEILDEDGNGCEIEDIERCEDDVIIIPKYN